MENNWELNRDVAEALGWFVAWANPEWESYTLHLDDKIVLELIVALAGILKDN